MIYFNENDPYPARWLMNLYPDAVTDTRSIKDVEPDDLAGFRRCHFFGGIGGWEYALKLAGWPADREVWTGSCPCQPFSAAGQQKGTADERHLWPEFLRLIAVRRPATILGEQVASKLGREWFAGVRADMEALGYAVGATDLCAASAGAPDIRQRLWWVAYALRSGRDARRAESGNGSTARCGGAVCLADAERRSTERHRYEVAGSPSQDQGGEEERQWIRNDAGNGEPTRRLADTDGGQSGDGGVQRGGQHGLIAQDGRVSGMGDANDARSQRRRLRSDKGADERATWTSGPDVQPWRDFIWLPCSDGKARRIKPSIFPLAHGISGGRVALGSAVQSSEPALSQEEAAHEFSRIGVLRGAGNAIPPWTARDFIVAFLEAERELTAD